MSVSAFADDHAYTEGAVVNMARIRTVDGRCRRLHEVAQHQLEAATGSREEGRLHRELPGGLGVEPRTLDDADLLLVTTYKNWASLDGALAKDDAIAKQFEGSVEASNQAQFDRAKIRRVLGSSTMQVARAEVKTATASMRYGKPSLMPGFLFWRRH